MPEYGGGPGPTVRSGEAPEGPDEPEPVEDRLVLLAAVRSPVRRQAVAPPGQCQACQLLDGERRSRRSRTEPAPDVLFRPEEVHPASGKDDVVPPPRRREEAVEERSGGLHRCSLDLPTHRLPAVRAGALHPGGAGQRRPDPEGVPG